MIVKPKTSKRELLELRLLFSSGGLVDFVFIIFLNFKNSQNVHFNRKNC